MAILKQIRETYTQHRRLFLWIVILLVLAALLWFVFRPVALDFINEKNAERDLILRQRDEARARIVRDSIANANFIDSMYKVSMGIQTRVEYRIKWRTEYVNRYIDTASVRTKFLYIDSLLGPK